MTLGNLHVLDFLVIAAYIFLVIWIGRRTSKGAGDSQQSFFLAGRKLGKLYQFFLNFGNSTDANGAVSTASFVYQKGASGVWLLLSLLFINPYLWFMNGWFRRVRLVTVADLFEDRFGGRGMARFYAGFQVLAAVIFLLGFGNLIGYKVTASLLAKPQAEWTASELASVEGYRELKRLEARVVASATSETSLAPEELAQLDILRERAARGELRSTISWIDNPTGKLGYYVLYTLIVGSYIVMGGLAATALNEALQGALIIVFSFILIPFGLSAIGGWGQLSARVPSEMFDMLGGAASGVGGWELLGLVLVTIVQINGGLGNMSIPGSAKNEFAARVGAVSGTYAKRFMIIMWAVCGLIAIALYQGANQLSDPDAAWGTMSLQLLPAGLLGLMMAGLLAANMSTIAAQTTAVSALFTRNIYLYLRPQTSDRGLVTVGRWTMVGLLISGVIAAFTMDDVYAVMQLVLTVNVPFGAVVVLIFFWRRLTAPAVWAALLLSALFNTVVPSFVASHIGGIANSPALTLRVEQDGRQMPVYFETVTRSDPDDLMSPLVGSGRFHTELWVLSKLGFNPAAMSATGRNAARYLFDAFFPFVVLIGVSLVTRAPNPRRTDLFFGKMKTPVGETPELEAAAMEQTQRNPRRFDNTKLFGAHSSWEFAKWDRVDAVGFVICLFLSGSILAGFWLLLKAMAGTL